jgi:hypothetical protein
MVAEAEGSGCAEAKLEVRAAQGALEATSSRPAADAIGDWIDLGLTAQEIDPSRPVAVEVEPSGADCTVRLAEVEGQPAVRTFVEDPDGPIHLIGTTDGWLYERPSAKPMVRAYSDWVTVPDDAAAREQFLRDPTIPSVVGTDEQPDDPGGEVSVSDTTFGDDEVRTTVDSDGRALVSVVQSASPGWTVQVDGEPAELVELHGAFTAVVVPEGTHEVTFAFRPPAFFAGVAVSLAAAGFGLVALVTDWWIRRRRTAPTEARQPLSSA